MDKEEAKVLKGIIDIFREHKATFGIDPGSIKINSRFQEYFETGNVDKYELVYFLEKKFHISFRNEEIFEENETVEKLLFWIVLQKEADTRTYNFGFNATLPEFNRDYRKFNRENKINGNAPLPKSLEVEIESARKAAQNGLIHHMNSHIEKIELYAMKMNKDFSKDILEIEKIGYLNELTIQLTKAEKHAKECQDYWMNSFIIKARKSADKIDKDISKEITRIEGIYLETLREKLN